ncbi:MAG: hypothetical protein WAZ77_12105 [Candidatus Nitrosopolaris sp.]|jgi:hypothetical protein
MLPEAVKPELGYFGFAGQFMETRLVKNMKCCSQKKRHEKLRLKKWESSQDSK